MCCIIWGTTKRPPDGDRKPLLTERPKSGRSTADMNSIPQSPAHANNRKELVPSCLEEYRKQLWKSGMQPSFTSVVVGVCESQGIPPTDVVIRMVEVQADRRPIDQEWWNRELARKVCKPRKPIPSAVRATVWDMTGGRCTYCGVQTNPFRDFSIDHVVPVVKGGGDDVINLVPCCRSCNSRKGAA